MRTMLKKKNIFALLLTVVLVVCMSVSVFAKTSEGAVDSLSNGVYTDVGKNTYQYAGGGSVAGTGLFEQVKTSATDTASNGYWTVKESEFNKLSSSEQTRFLTDVVDSTNEIVADGSSTYKEVDDSTAQEWWKRLQSKTGVGSKFMAVLLKDTKPDFVAANAIWKPFSGPVGVLLGLGAVIIMSLLGLVIVADIAYIALPPVRIFAEEGGEGKKGGIRSHLFSYEATQAVKIAENGGGNGNGETKQALGIYFKRRVVMLIVLGICLMYLVNGQIYTLVGWILDLVSGFLKF